MLLFQVKFYQKFLINVFLFILIILLIIFLIKKNKLNIFNTYLEMNAVTRLDLYSDLFGGKKKLSKCEKNESF